MDCQKTANSPWYNACSITLTDFFLLTELSVHRLVPVKNANFCCSLSPRFFKKASGILQSPPSVRPSVRLSVRLSVRPSVCPSRYLLLNRWTKFNQIWCVSCSHGKGVQRHIFFWPRPLGPWGGAKRSNIVKYH